MFSKNESRKTEGEVNLVGHGLGSETDKEDELILIDLSKEAKIEERKSNSALDHIQTTLNDRSFLSECIYTHMIDKPEQNFMGVSNDTGANGLSVISTYHYG